MWLTAGTCDVRCAGLLHQPRAEAQTAAQPCGVLTAHRYVRCTRAMQARDADVRFRGAGDPQTHRRTQVKTLITGLTSTVTSAQPSLRASLILSLGTPLDVPASSPYSCAAWRPRSHASTQHSQHTGPQHKRLSCNTAAQHSIRPALQQKTSTVKTAAPHTSRSHTSKLAGLGIQHSVQRHAAARHTPACNHPHTLLGAAAHPASNDWARAPPTLFQFHTQTSANPAASRTDRVRTAAHRCTAQHSAAASVGCLKRPPAHVPAQ